MPVTNCSKRKRKADRLWEWHIRIRDNALGESIVAEALRNHRLPSQQIVYILDRFFNWKKHMEAEANGK